MRAIDQLHGRMAVSIHRSQGDSFVTPSASLFRLNKLQMASTVPRARNKAGPTLFDGSRFDVAVKRRTRAVAMVENIRLWRLRAEELRLLASTIEDAPARLGVLNAARSYDAIAAKAEASLRSDTVVGELPANSAA